MALPTRWIRSVVVLAAVVGAVVVAERWADPARAGGGLVPSVGGDTWPPVPVKDSRRV